MGRALSEEGPRCMGRSPRHGVSTDTRCVALTSCRVTTALGLLAAYGIASLRPSPRDWRPSPRLQLRYLSLRRQGALGRISGRLSPASEMREVLPAVHLALEWSFR